MKSHLNALVIEGLLLGSSSKSSPSSSPPRPSSCRQRILAADLLTVQGTQVTREALPDLPTGGVSTVPPGWMALLQRDLEFVLFPPAMAAVEIVHHRSRTPTVIYMPLIAVTAIVAVGFTLLLARRRGLNRSAQLSWSVLSLLFGLYAQLTLICLRERPARIPCPACGKARRVNGDRCEHCGAAGTPAKPKSGTMDDLARRLEESKAEVKSRRHSFTRAAGPNAIASLH